MSASHAPATWRLPSPPDDIQKWAYYGPQRRWVLVTGMVTTTVVVGALVKFAVGTPGAFWALGLAVVLLTGVAITSYTSTRKRRFTADEHRALVAAYYPTAWPSVDVFLPSAGEDLAVLGNTFAAAATLQWPGPVRVYVLDDSARDAVADLASGHGFTYLSRPNRGELKKAGNLRYGYERSDGDFIVVFDADFAPRPDFLSELIPHFFQSGPAVGIVQSPQFFDTLPQQNWLQRAAGATQELFYRWVQPSRDAAGSPICVGTNAIYRREALRAAGGFAQIGHSEDVHTGVNCLKAGWRTRYVPVNLAKGLCPDDLSGFINQQYRWCTGSMSLLADRSFHRTRLGWRGKLPYFSGFFYYVSTALLVFAMPLPTAMMLWFNHEAVQLTNYTLVVPAMAFGWLVFPRMLHARWGPEVLRVQVIYAHAHALAICDILRGRTAAWVPTGASQATDARSSGRSTPVRVRRLMRVWIPLSQAILWLGLAHVMYRRGFLPFLPIAGFIGLTSIVQWPILWAIREPGDPAAWFCWRLPWLRLRVRARKAVLVPTTAFVLGATTLAGTATAYTLHEAAAFANALPASARAELAAGRLPAEVGVDRAETRTADLDLTAGGPCVESAVKPSKMIADMTVDGVRYSASLTQSVHFCADGVHAPVITDAWGVDHVRDAPAARINVDHLHTSVDVPCTRLPAPCTAVVTTGDGEAVSLAGTTVVAGSAVLTTEIGVTGKSLTWLEVHRTH